MDHVLYKSNMFQYLFICIGTNMFLRSQKELNDKKQAEKKIITYPYYILYEDSTL